MRTWFFNQCCHFHIIAQIVSLKLLSVHHCALNILHRSFLSVKYPHKVHKSCVMGILIHNLVFQEVQSRVVLSFCKTLWDMDHLSSDTIRKRDMLHKVHNVAIKRNSKKLKQFEYLNCYKSILPCTISGHSTSMWWYSHGQSTSKVIHRVAAPNSIYWCNDSKFPSIKIPPSILWFQLWWH